MAQRLTIYSVGLAAALFSLVVPLGRLFDAFQPMIVAGSIVVAAILVRLNRGMPTLDWKSLEANERSKLTQGIVDLTVEYLVILGANATLLITLVSLTVVGKVTVAGWPQIFQTIGSAVIGALAVLCVARMTYVVWRDLDIVRLQKRLIDASGIKDQNEAQAKIAAQKIADIRGASLRKTGSSD
jgi:hypothetical protein